MSSPSSPMPIGVGLNFFSESDQPEIMLGKNLEEVANTLVQKKYRT